MEHDYKQQVIAQLTDEIDENFDTIIHDKDQKNEIYLQDDQENWNDQENYESEEGSKRDQYNNDLKNYNYIIDDDEL